MNRAAILRKIKACLRLAASSNPNEAAAALRQARVMMEAHGVTSAEAMDVGEAEVTTRSRGAVPPRSVCNLVGLVADGFGAQVLILRGYNQTLIRFYGTDGSADIAVYAFTVLRRQMDADRLKHIVRVRKRGNREARGEVFALAWVNAVAHLFPSAEVAEAKRLAIAEVFKLRHPDVSTGPGRDLTKRGKASDDDALAGHRAGRTAKLHRGVNAQQKTLEHIG